MILIAVNNFQDEDSLGFYELPEGSLIKDLKAEIEATEGIPIGHQRLVRDKEHNNQDLEDNENFDSLISDGSPRAIIYLVQARIFCRLKQQDITECNDTSNPQIEDEVVGISVNLDTAINESSLWWTLKCDHKIHPSLANISVLGFDGRPTADVLDLKKPFSYYGICNGDTIHIVYAPWEQFEIWLGLRQAGYGIDDPVLPPSFRALKGKGTIVRAKYDWNGEIMHPNIKGLSLKHTALFAIFDTSRIQNFNSSPEWLYGAPISLSEVSSSRLSRRLRTRGVEGYFPVNFVSVVDETEQHSEVTSTELLDVPPLPPFRFPPARGMIFRMPISDKGHSFLKFTVNYECVSSPVDPTHVTISLLCTTYDVRRVSAVGVFITIPGSELLAVQVCENEAHQKEIHTDKEVTETQSKGKHFDGINIGTLGTTVGFQGGASRTYSLDDTETGQSVSRRKVTAGIDKADTIFWNLKAPTSKFDKDGLDGEESITLILKKKPAQFKYNCRVTHARDGAERITERITGSLWERFFQ